MPTKRGFLAAYKAEMIARFPWAKNEPEGGPKMTRFLAQVAKALAGEPHMWSVSGAAAEEAWRLIGGQGKMKLDKLIALPEGDAP